MDSTKKIALTSASVLACCAPALAADSGRQDTDKPNIIFLLFDDLGYGDLGCYGQNKIETPNIDALASQGVLFTDMYTAAPLSAPSRCCIMTGKHSGHSQIRANKEHYDKTPELGFNAVFLKDIPDIEGQFPMNAGTRTIGHMMKDAGYATAMVGKWGLGFPESESTPNKMGFDYFYGFMCHALAHSYYPTALWENGERFLTGNRLVMQGQPLPAELDPMDVKSYEQYSGKYYSPDLMYDKLEKFVCDNSAHPFFAMWTTTVPHSAVQAPLDEVMYYVDKLGDEEPITDGGQYLPSRYPHATYAAMVTHIDTQVGKMVKKLKELGIWDNTIFIVTSDNGPACNGNSPMEYFQSGGPFRCRKGWGKSSLHEGGIRMPFIVSGGACAGPARTSHVAIFSDIMPTFAEIAGVQAPENDGISFLPTLNGGDQKEHEYLYWEYPSAKGWVAVRIGEWKGLVKKVVTGNTRMELFNLDTDPRELNDVAADHQDIVKKMWQIVKSCHCTPDNDEESYRLNIVYPEGI